MKCNRLRLLVCLVFVFSTTFITCSDDQSNPAADTSSNELKIGEALDISVQGEGPLNETLGAPVELSELPEEFPVERSEYDDHETMLGILEEVQNANGNIMEVLDRIYQWLVGTFGFIGDIIDRLFVGHGNMGKIRNGLGMNVSPEFIGEPAEPQPLPPKNVPYHPYAGDNSGAHVDTYNSGVTDWDGPLGINPEVYSRSTGKVLGMCAIKNFLPDNNVGSISYYVKEADILTRTATIGLDLALLDPDNLEVFDLYDLGATFEVKLLETLAGVSVDLTAGYFYMDNLGRIITGGENNSIQILEALDVGGSKEWELADRFELAGRIPLLSGNLIALTPDFSGNIWFVTQNGVIGYVVPSTGRVYFRRLLLEKFENAPAIGPDGVYAATDKALYRIGIAWLTKKPKIKWRRTYDAGSGMKPGGISRGTGSSPSLVGDDMVVITDNADDQVNLLVYERGSGDLVCQYPLFEQGASAVEVSPICYNDASNTYNSIIVQNNYNAPNAFGDYRKLAPGLARIDILPDKSGCVEVWINNDVPSTGTPRLSTANGLIYTYTQLTGVPLFKAWYLAAVDFRTGETVYMTRAGTGLLMHNYYANIEIGPNETVCQGVLNGLFCVRDGD